jgi:hypothetical protein
MSTEHVHDPYDEEYGPTPVGAKYEHTDIDPNVGYKFGLWLTVAMLMSFGIVFGAFRFFEGREESSNALAQKYPLAASVPHKEPPTPHLQAQPFKDIYMLRQGENEKLTSYGWVDKDGGVAHIPIDRAMEIMLQRGFPARAEGGNALNVVTQDSSSGRTVVPR